MAIHLSPKLPTRNTYHAKMPSLPPRRSYRMISGMVEFLISLYMIWRRPSIPSNTAYSSNHCFMPALMVKHGDSSTVIYKIWLHLLRSFLNYTWCAAGISTLTHLLSDCHGQIVLAATGNIFRDIYQRPLPWLSSSC